MCGSGDGRRQGNKSVLRGQGNAVESDFLCPQAVGGEQIDLSLPRQGKGQGLCFGVVDNQINKPFSLLPSVAVDLASVAAEGGRIKNLFPH